MSRIQPSDLRRIAWRTLLLQAAFNYERQQGIGWAYALDPALRRIYPDDALRRERLAEHTAYFNTQPTLASVALGAALAAIGDRLFWFTLRPFAACLGVLFAVLGSPFGALALLLSYNAIHLVLRFTGVRIGHAAGPGVLGSGLRDRLEAMVRRLGVLGCVLIGVLVAALLAPGGEPATMTFQATLIGGLLFGMLAALRSRPSPTQWALGLGALCLLAGFRR